MSAPQIINVYITDCVADDSSVVDGDGVDDDDDVIGNKDCSNNIVVENIGASWLGKIDE